jgi:hypothetical protein
MDRNSHNSDRSLQQSKADHLYVDFLNCKFERNTYGIQGPAMIEIGTSQVRVRIKNSIFYQNDYARGADVRTGLIKA